MLDRQRVEIELDRRTKAYRISVRRIASYVGGNAVDVLIRPDDTVHDDASSVQAKIMQKASRGADILYTLQLLGGSTALSLVPDHHNHAMGKK